MAKEQEPSVTTTLSVSRKFAEMIGDLARGSGKTIRDYCDGELMALLRPLAKKALRRRLEAVDLGGEG